jgi:hypothetical protein
MQQPDTRGTDTSDDTLAHPVEPSAPARQRRRRLIKTAVVAAAGVAAASGYVQPSVRALQTPVAHAFSF